MADNEKKRRTISKRQSTLKKEFLEFAQENGLVQIACRKTGIARPTYYRWFSTDATFARAAEKALRRGREVGCDMAESVIIGKITEKDIGAAKFYLIHNDPRYMTPARLHAKQLRKEFREASKALKTEINDPTDLEERQHLLTREYEEKLKAIIVEGRRPHSG